MGRFDSYAKHAPTAYANLVGRDRVMDMGIRPLWTGMPRIAGSAYPVLCAPGDNLMMHAAIHRAPAGSIVVVQGADIDYALAGRNMYRVAQRRGVAGFIVDGVVRDLRELRDLKFPVFARGVIPIAAKQSTLGILERPINCGGIAIALGDIVVADEEGVVVLPPSKADALVKNVAAQAAVEAKNSLETWETEHRACIMGTLREKNVIFDD